MQSVDHYVRKNSFSCIPTMPLFWSGGYYSKDVNIYFYGLFSSPEENEVVLLEWPMAAGIVW